MMTMIEAKEETHEKCSRPTSDMQGQKQQRKTRFPLLYLLLPQRVLLLSLQWPFGHALKSRHLNHHHHIRLQKKAKKTTQMLPVVLAAASAAVWSFRWRPPAPRSA
jgi:hypothetical protein